MPKNFKLLKVQSSKFKELLAFSFLATQITRESNPAILSGASLIYFVQYFCERFASSGFLFILKHLSFVENKGVEPLTS
jgi:hypothetical protein